MTYGGVIESMDYGVKQSSYPSSTTYFFKILGKLAWPQFPHLKNGNNNTSDLTDFLGGLNVIANTICWKKILFVESTILSSLNCLFIFAENYVWMCFYTFSPIPLTLDAYHYVDTTLFWLVYIYSKSWNHVVSVVQLRLFSKIVLAILDFLNSIWTLESASHFAQWRKLSTK